MHRNRRVYVIDDDSQVRLSLVFLLNTSGFTARSFDGGASFLENASTLPPGCVMLDLRMPGMDGLTVMDVLKGRLEDFPVIVITGHGDISTAVRAMKLGARDYLEKPFVEELVLEALTHAFKSLEASQSISDGRIAAASRISKLSPREADVLCGLVDGLPNKIIAYNLQLSTRTIEMYRASMMERLGVRSLPEALRLAYIVGLSEIRNTARFIEPAQAGA
jgi:two-component system, LuxR family, response regulator FixJ